MSGEKERRSLSLKKKYIALMSIKHLKMSYNLPQKN